MANDIEFYTKLEELIKERRPVHEYTALHTGHYGYPPTVSLMELYNIRIRSYLDKDK